MKRAKNDYPSAESWRNLQDGKSLDEVYFQDLHDRIMGAVLKETLILKKKNRKHLSVISAQLKKG